MLKFPCYRVSEIIVVVVVVAAVDSVWNIFTATSLLSLRLSGLSLLISTVDRLNVVVYAALCVRDVILAAH